MRIRCGVNLAEPSLHSLASDLILALYWPALLVVALAAFLRGIRAPRSSLIGLAAFAAICLSGIRWDLIPVPAIGSIFLLSVLGAGALWLLMHLEPGRQPEPVAALAYLLAMAALVLVVFFRALPMVDPSGGLVKGAGLVLRGALGAVVLVGFGRLTPADIKGAATGILIGGTLAAVALVASGKILTERASISDSTNPITVGRIIGLGAVVAFIRAIAGPRRGGLRSFLYGGLGLFLLLAGMLTGSRGPFLASLVAVGGALALLPSGAAPRALRLRRVVVALALATMVAVPFIPRLLELGGVARIVDSMSNLQGSHTSVQRIEFYRRALAALPDDATFGAGPGAFEVISNGRAKYPHNMELEVLVELGIPGALAVAALLGIPALTLVGRLRGRPFDTDELTLAACWAASVLNAQVSGSITTNSDVWITGALVTLLGSPPEAPPVAG